jgi:hypothetical protein
MIVRNVTRDLSRITFDNFPRTESGMDIRGWESLWKVFAIIGIANLFFFFVILFASTLDNSTILWILIGIYMLLRCFDRSSTYSSTSALMHLQAI